MAELLSHVLIAFCLFTVASWWIDWLDREWIAVGMVGAIIPDLNRIGLLVDDGAIEAATGISFSWSAIHTLGGVLIVAGIGAALFQTRREMVLAYGLLVAGGLSHLVVDALKRWADGYGGAYLFPFSWWRNPTPGWYVSADWWVVVVVGLVALVVVVIDRRYVTAVGE